MSADILREIEKSRFRQIYLFYGSDLTVSDEVIEQLKQKLLVPGLEMFDYDNFTAQDLGRSEGLSIPMLIQRINQPPVGAPRRLIVVRHLEQMNMKTLQEFIPALKAVPDSTTLVLVCSYDPNRHRELQRLFKENGLDKFLISVSGAPADRLVAQLQRWARAKGLELDQSAAALLIEIAGEDPNILKTEIEKFATALQSADRTGKPCRVNLDDIRNYASSTRIFELRDYVQQCLERNPALALATLRRLEDLGEEPKKIIGWLASALIDVLSVKLGLRSPASLWRCPRTAPQWWKVAELDFALQRLFKIDLSILQGHREVFSLLDIWTVTCCQRR